MAIKFPANVSGQKAEEILTPMLRPQIVGPSFVRSDQTYPWMLAVSLSEEHKEQAEDAREYAENFGEVGLWTDVKQSVEGMHQPPEYSKSPYVKYNTAISAFDGGFHVFRGNLTAPKTDKQQHLTLVGRVRDSCAGGAARWDEPFIDTVNIPYDCAIRSSIDPAKVFDETKSFGPLLQVQLVVPEIAYVGKNFPYMAVVKTIPEVAGKIDELEEMAGTSVDEHIWVDVRAVDETTYSPDIMHSARRPSSHRKANLIPELFTGGYWSHQGAMCAPKVSGKFGLKARVRDGRDYTNSSWDDARTDYKSIELID